MIPTTSLSTAIDALIMKGHAPADTLNDVMSCKPLA